MKITGFLILLLFFNSACKQDTPITAELTGYSLEDLGNGAQLAVLPSESNGFITNGTLINKSKTGAWITYHSDGKSIKTISNYIRGKKSGVELVLNERGQIEHLKGYKNDVLHGYQAKYRFGQPLEETSYRNGSLDGPFAIYDEQGNIQRKGSYKAAKPHGILQYFNESGQVIMQYEYQNGEKISGGIVETTNANN